MDTEARSWLALIVVLAGILFAVLGVTKELRQIREALTAGPVVEQEVE